jgi:hypothetical protein
MADHVAHDWAPRLGRALVALVIAAAIAAVTVLIAIVSFDVNPAGPVIIVLAGLVGGGFVLHAGREVVVRGVGYGLILGGLVTVLFWPFFDVGA